MLRGSECLFGKELSDFPEARLGEVDVLVSAIFAGGQPKVIEELWPKLTKATWIHSLSAGVDTLMPVLARIPGTEPVPVTNAKGAFSRSLAEYALCAMLHFCKQIPRLQAPRRPCFCLLRGESLERQLAEVHHERAPAPSLL